MEKRTKTLLFGIVTLAAVLRFAALDRIPPGIYPDEALNGTEGYHAAATGDFKVFYPTNNGREGLWINLIGIVVKTLGLSQFSLRFLSALVGTLTVLGLFFLARELFKSDRTALLSAFFLATSFWHLNFSRIAFRAITVPLLLVWSFYFLLRAFRAFALHKQITNNNADAKQILGIRHAICYMLFAAIGGALFGLGFHTYIAFRFAPFVLLVLFLVEYFKGNAAKSSALKVISYFVAAAFLAALPIGLYFYHNPQDFFGRAGSVSIFTTDSPLHTFGSVLVKTLGMFNVRGDCNWRHNMGWPTCSPQFLLPVSIFFLIGLWLSLKSIISKKARNSALKAISWFLFSWFVFLLLPELLTWESIPHALRSIGVLPPVILFAALGANWVYEWISRRLAFVIRYSLFVILGFTLLSIAIIEPYRYFGVWAKNKNTAYAFSKPYVEIGFFLNTRPPSTPRYVVANVGGVPVPHVNPDGTKKMIPMPAQTVLFTTLKHKSATYLLPEDIEHYTFPSGSVIVTLERDEHIFDALRKYGYDLMVMQSQYFNAGIVK